MRGRPLPPGQLFTLQAFAGVVIGHGFTVLKKSLVDEGHILARAGYVTLAIDYRSFGESEGEPRGHLVPLDQVEDFRNAISFLPGRRRRAQAHRYLGLQFAGGFVIYTAAVDRRVKAVVCQSRSPTDGYGTASAFGRGVRGDARRAGPRSRAPLQGRAECTAAEFRR